MFLQTRNQTRLGEGLGGLERNIEGLMRGGWKLLEARAGGQGWRPGTPAPTRPDISSATSEPAGKVLIVHSHMHSPAQPSLCAWA